LVAVHVSDDGVTLSDVTGLSRHGPTVKALFLQQ